MQIPHSSGIKQPGRSVQADQEAILACIWINTNTLALAFYAEVLGWMEQKWTQAEQEIKRPWIATRP